MGNRRNLLLYPFSILYRLITDFRNFLYNTGLLPSEEFDIPLICVGNITVGGTGKTPHAEYLIDLLRKDFKVALLSRGYKRKSTGFRIASHASTVSEIGDEPLQVFHKFPEILVAVDKDRANGIKTIMTDHPETDVIILDDGFQHRRVKPGFSVLLTDYSRLITRDYMMPYGRLREGHANSKRADVIVVSKTPEVVTGSSINDIIKEVRSNDEQKIYFSSVSYNDLIPLFKAHSTESVRLREEDRENSGVVLVTGIAASGSLKEFLRKYFAEIVHFDFPDHHYFSGNDIVMIRKAWKNLKSKKKIIISTEKDAVRLREFTNIDDSEKRAFYYIPVVISFMKDHKRGFDNIIIDYVRRNKRDNRVS